MKSASVSISDSRLTSRSFVGALRALLGDIDPRTVETASRVEVALQASSANSVAIAQMLAEISLSLGLGPTEVGRLAASTIANISYSASWLAKLVRAGSIRTSWPQLEDILNVDKLATLYRVPRKLQQAVFDSGRFPDGRHFRELDREQLAAAVRTLRSESKLPPPKNPHREAYRELVRLEEALSQALTQISPHSKYGAVRERLAAWQAELKKVTDDKVIPRMTVLTAQSPSSFFNKTGE